MSQQEAKKGRIEVLDIIRALAIIHVIVYHYYIEWFQGSFLIVPNGILANITRLEVFKDGGITGFIKNLFSFIFVYGFSSVNLFLILSGFVLAYSMLKRDNGENKIIKSGHSWLKFFGRRMKRIFVPFYVSVLIGIAFLFLRNILFPSLSAVPVYNIFDVLKLIFVPFIFYDMSLLQLFNGDYWFVPLILQLYLVFPLLYLLLKKIKPARFLLLVFIAAVSYRMYASYFLDTVPMGVIYPSQNSYRLFSFFLPRLFEFSLGMAAAYYYFKNHTFIKKMSSGICIFAGAFLALCGYSFNAYRWGWAFSDPFAGTGLFLLFLGLGRIIMKSKIAEKILMKTGGASYETFLLHHYFLNYMLMPAIMVFGFKQEWAFWVLMPVYVAVSVVLGIGGKAVSDSFVVMISRAASPE
jgi:peptidoglycan/LPS O-acetylase OafA/YrhL